jgi:hypothetical protein
MVSACQFTEVLQWEHPRSLVLFEVWDLLGFASSKKHGPESQDVKNALSSSKVVEINRFPNDVNQVRIHPLQVHCLRERLPAQQPLNKQKVVWISRQGMNGGGTGRQCQNEGELLDYLRQGAENLVVFRPRMQNEISFNIQALTNLLGDACAIVGFHGGQLYNQYFANDETAGMELTVLDDRGLFHQHETGQNVPPHAHRALWHNANVLSQPYWRLHFVSDKGTDFLIRRETMDAVVRILTLATCETK